MKGIFGFREMLYQARINCYDYVRGWYIGGDRWCVMRLDELTVTDNLPPIPFELNVETGDYRWLDTNELHGSNSLTTGVNEQRSDALYTPETGYAIVVAKRNLSNATKRMVRAKRNLTELSETIKTTGGDILPHVTRVCAIQRDIDSARQAVYRWECKLLSLGYKLLSLGYKVD